MNLLLSLPDALVLQLVNQWLCLKDIVNVDSAFCGCQQRVHLLNNVFQSPHFELHGITSIEKLHLANICLLWVFLRGISVQTLLITESTNRLLCRMYLKKFGKGLRGIHFHGLIQSEVAATEFLCLLPLYCPNIRSLVCRYCTMSEAIYDVLVNCANLEHLKLKDFDEDSWSAQFNVNHLVECTYAHLKTINIDAMNYGDDEKCNASSVVLKLNDPSCVQRLSMKSASARVLSLWMSELPCYAQLTALGLAQIDELTDFHVADIVRCCPNIAHLDLSGCRGLTDQSAIVVAHGFSALRSLGVAYGAAGDAMMFELATFRATTLEVLHAQCCPRITKAGLEAVLRRCTKLHTLSMENAEARLLVNLDSTLFGNITTLYMSFHVSHGHDVLTTLTRHCRKLQCLFLSYFIEWCQLPYSELSALNLPDLRLLSINREHDQGYGSGVVTDYERAPAYYSDLQLLSDLQDVRPELHIEYAENEVEYEVMETMY